MLVNLAQNVHLVDEPEWEKPDVAIHTPSSPPPVTTSSGPAATSSVPTAVCLMRCRGLAYTGIGA